MPRSAVWVCLLTGIAALSGACTRPRACTADDEYEERVVFESDRFSRWQEKTRTAVRDALELDRVDARIVPVAVREPAERPAKGTAVLLHGHGFSALRILEEGQLGERLARLGWRVVAPALRGFARFPGGIRTHNAYLDTLQKDAYLPLVVGDLLRTLEHETAGRTGPVVVMGHSLGAHLALHLASLEPRIKGVALVGLFVRTSCINSREHHFCQHHEKLATLVGAEDLAALIAPRMLGVFWGEKDRFFTAAARGLFKRTQRRFAAVGAKDSLSLHVSPNRGHEIDSRAVVRFFEALPL